MYLWIHALRGVLRAGAELDRCRTTGRVCVCECVPANTLTVDGPRPELLSVRVDHALTNELVTTRKKPIHTPEARTIVRDPDLVYDDLVCSGDRLRRVDKRIKPRIRVITTDTFHNQTSHIMNVTVDKVSWRSRRRCRASRQVPGRTPCTLR